MAFNQLTDEQIDDEILRMAIEESMNLNIHKNDDIGENDDEDEILQRVIEESKINDFENIVKENDKFLSDTLNRFKMLNNMEKIEKIEKIENTENIPLTLEQLREKRLKRFAPKY